tara:strand:+ start:19 stop:531 length:513 start_codon:yes stop_codon:yes gene_type:complete
MKKDTIADSCIETIAVDPESQKHVVSLHMIGEAIVEESAAFNSGVMSEKIDALIAGHKQDSSTTCCYFACDQTNIETPIGAIAGFIQESWFDGGVSLNDFFLWVHPDWRSTNAASKLIETYEKFGHDAGVNQINLGISTGLRQRALGRFYEYSGYTLSATQYSKEINNVL